MISYWLLARHTNTNKNMSTDTNTNTIVFTLPRSVILSFGLKQGEMYSVVWLRFFWADYRSPAEKNQSLCIRFKTALPAGRRHPRRGRPGGRLDHWDKSMKSLHPAWEKNENYRSLRSRKLDAIWKEKRSECFEKRWDYKKWRVELHQRFQDYCNVNAA